MRVSLCILGVEVFALEISSAGEVVEEEAEPTAPTWGGQSNVATHIESPPVPYDMWERYRWEWEDHRRGRRLGFH